MQLLKSRTTQNVGITAAVVLVADALIARVAPDLSEHVTPEIVEALRVLVIAVVTAIGARGLAFWRNPQKRS